MVRVGKENLVFFDTSSNTGIVNVEASSSTSVVATGISCIKGNTGTNFAIDIPCKSINLKGSLVQYELFIKDAAVLAKINNTLIPHGTGSILDSSVNTYLSDGTGYICFLKLDLTTGWNTIYLTQFNRVESAKVPMLEVMSGIKKIRLRIFTVATTDEFIEGDVIIRNIYYTYPSSSKEKEIKTNYPVTDGLTAGTTTQTGHQENLIPLQGSNVPRRYKVGM